MGWTRDVQNGKINSRLPRRTAYHHRARRFRRRADEQVSKETPC